MGKAKKVVVPQIRAPWLLQRCVPKVEFNTSLKTGDYLKLDYMGSAEFEFGAIPKFQREMYEKLNRLYPASVTHNGTTLHFLAELSQVVDYQAVLVRLIDNDLRLKESMHLNHKETLYVGKKQTAVYDAPHAPFSTTVWFDLTNNVIIARDEKVLKNLLITIPNSINYMNQQAVV